MEAVSDAATTLPPEPGSVGIARRFVTRTLVDAGHDEHVDAAALLVSELATNALLHAGTVIDVRCRTGPGIVRVDVRDGSALVPARRGYEGEATTGRGLEMVDALAARWGIEPDAGGKTMWFELGVPPEDHPTAAGAPSPGAGLPVVLVGAPVRLIPATIEYGDAVLREVALLALSGELQVALPDGWHLPQFDVTPVLAAAEAAAGEGRERADLELTVPADAGATALERLSLIDLADGLARRGELLSSPALPEIGACRHWLYSQIAEQAAGAAPVAWELPAPLAPAQVAARLPASELDRVAGATTPVVVADDANRVIAANAAAEDLLGWGDGTLIGQRLIVIIPPELREAHVAGFTRLQLTGEPRFLGRPLRVPALRRDGGTVDVELVLTALGGAEGRRAYRAELRPAVGGHRGEGT